MKLAAPHGARAAAADADTRSALDADLLDRISAEIAWARNQRAVSD